jgi:hypothetical protein
MAPRILFMEEQTFSKSVILKLVKVINLVLLTVCAFILIKGTDLKTNGVFVFGPLVVIFIIVGYMLSKAKLVTQVREDGIYVRYFPFHRKFRIYKWEDIDQLYLRKYDPIREYGGWGVRLGFNGRAFNVSGNIGLQIITTHNEKLLIGTNAPDDMIGILSQLGRLDIRVVMNE